MSIFGTIMAKVFGHAAEAAPATPGAAPTAAPGATATQTAAPTVDVAAVLTDMAGKAGQPLNWKQSIVDLMKLLGLDSSLASRTELAKELGYSGDTNDSATMNLWLHKEVMRKFAENGGKVPDDLKS